MARDEASESHVRRQPESSHDARSTRGPGEAAWCARRASVTIRRTRFSEEARSPSGCRGSIEMPQPARPNHPEPRHGRSGAVRPVSSSRSRRRLSGDAACTQLQKSAGVRSASSDAQPSNAIEASSSCALSSVSPPPPA